MQEIVNHVQQQQQHAHPALLLKCYTTINVKVTVLQDISTILVLVIPVMWYVNLVLQVLLVTVVQIIFI